MDQPTHSKEEALKLLPYCNTELEVLDLWKPIFLQQKKYSLVDYRELSQAFNRRMDFIKYVNQIRYQRPQF